MVIKRKSKNLLIVFTLISLMILAGYFCFNIPDYKESSYFQFLEETKSLPEFSPSLINLGYNFFSLFTNVTAETGARNFTHLNISNTAPYNSLVGYWSFDGDAEQTLLTKAYDFSGNGNDGTYAGHANATASGCPVGYGKCGGFDGSGDYILTDLKSLSNDTYTLSVWFKNAESATALKYLLGGYISSTSNERIKFRMGSDNTLNFVDDYSVSLSAGSVTANVWHHTVLSYDFTNQNATIFLDGITKQSDNGFSQAPPTDFTNGIQIGILITGTSAFNGTIDDVMIFNTSLTAQQISDIYNNQSARFVGTGNQEINLNIPAGNNQIDVLTTFDSNFGSDVSLSVDYYDGIWHYNEPQFLISGINSTFNISSSSTNLTLNYTLSSGNNLFYTSVIYDNILVDFHLNEEPDEVYPQFLENLNNNGSLEGSGIGLLNITVVSSNNTVILNFNGNKIPATEIGEDIYSVSIFVPSPGTYPGYWEAYGNGSLNNYNSSEIFYYILNPLSCISSEDCSSLSGDCGIGLCNLSLGRCYVNHNETTNICREFSSECDEEEYCNGIDINCPINLNKSDGTLCNSSLGRCQLGICMNLECLNDGDCNSDGCYSGQYRNYYCSLSNTCEYNLLVIGESFTNSNCADGVDNDCDGLIDLDEECFETSIIADHNAARDFDKIPDSWLDKTKELTLHYAHRSDGNQILEGLAFLNNQDPAKYGFRDLDILTGGVAALPAQISPPALRVMDGNPPLDSYVYDYRYWKSTPEPGIETTISNSATGLFNYSMWSWCNELADSHYSTSQIQEYLNQMNAFEQQFPDMRFIHHTGFTDEIDAINRIDNQYIRDYVLNNSKVLYDFDDIGKYDPDGNYYSNADRACTWCANWCTNHPSDCASLPSSCSHSDGYGRFICIQRGKAFWWLLARLAGWDGVSECEISSDCSDGESCVGGNCTQESLNCSGEDNNCNPDGCYSGQYRNYYCNLNDACEYNIINVTESLNEGNCADNIDNDCDGLVDSEEASCLVQCWNGENLYLYGDENQFKKFCKCTQGQYSYLSTRKLFSQYSDWGDNDNWGVMNVIDSPVFSVQCSDGIWYPVNQNYFK